MAHSRVIVREFRPQDASVVVPMWKRGFFEMWPHTYKRAVSTPAPFLSCAALSGVAYLAGRTTLAAVLAGFGVLWYTPVMKWVVGALFWGSISLQARYTMNDIPSRWMVRGKSNFWTAEVDGVIVGCVAAKTLHTLAGEKLGKRAKKQQKGVKAADVDLGALNGGGGNGQGGAGRDFGEEGDEVATVPGEASIWRLTVAPSARRLGVGRALMSVAEDWARQNGCTHVSLVTGNPESQQFYRRLGYDTEAEDRARLVLFGGQGVLGEKTGFGLRGMFKLSMLRRRLHEGKTVMVKHLV